MTGRFDFRSQRAGQNFNYSLVLQKIDVPPFYLSLPSFPARSAHCPLLFYQHPSRETPCYEKSMDRPYATRVSISFRRQSKHQNFKEYFIKTYVCVCKIIESQRSIYTVLFDFYRNRDYWRIYLDLFSSFREFILLPFHCQHHQIQLSLDILKIRFQV